VDVGLLHDGSDVARLDAPAVLDADAFGRLGASYVLDRRADHGAHRLGILRGGVAAGSDRPDRLVGDDHLPDGRLGDPGQPGPDLALDLRLGAARLALVQGLADAHDRRHPWAMTAFALRFTPSSVSPKSSRRPECPTLP